MPAITLRNRTMLLATVAFSCLAPFAGAKAQTGTQTPAASSVLDEVLVTATRQADTVNRVSLAITAATQKTMDQKGVRTLADLQTQLPSVQINQIAPGIANVAIRGIANNGGGSATTPKANEATQVRRGPRYPEYARVEGWASETRPPEKKDGKPSFAQQTRAPFHATAPFEVTTLTSELYAAWGLAVLPSGDLLVTERLPGAMRILSKDGRLSPPVKGVAALAPNKQIGLLDVVLDPDFQRNRRIFFSYIEWADRNADNTNIARARLDLATGSLSEVKAIFRAAPKLPAKGDLSAGTKTGGRLAFGRDGFLYAVIGDRDSAGGHPWPVAQSLDNHMGKTIRITIEGRPAPGNPYIGVAGALPEIWALGQRSQEGLAFDAAGQLWETEHGPRGGDELNLIRKGKNYGWPLVSHGIDYSGVPIGEGQTDGPGLEPPVYYWDPSLAISGLAFYQGSMFPEWKGSVFVGAMRGYALMRLKLAGGKVVEEEPLLTGLRERIRDVRVGRDGTVYVLTDSGTGTINDTSPQTGKVFKLTRK